VDPAATLGVCEPTGVYGLRLQQALSTGLASLHQINAQTLRASSFWQVRTKTDQADAVALARAACRLWALAAQKAGTDPRGL
jgi:transposase